MASCAQRPGDNGSDWPWVSVPGRQPGLDTLGCKQAMGSAIAARGLECVADFPIDICREPLQTNGGTCDVAAQTFKALPLVGLVGLAGDSSVQ